MVAILDQAFDSPAVFGAVFSAKTSIAASAPNRPRDPLHAGLHRERHLVQTFTVLCTQQRWCRVPGKTSSTRSRARRRRRQFLISSAPPIACTAWNRLIVHGRYRDDDQRALLQAFPRRCLASEPMARDLQLHAERGLSRGAVVAATDLGATYDRLAGRAMSWPSLGNQRRGNEMIFCEAEVRRTFWFRGVAGRGSNSPTSRITYWINWAAKSGARGCDSPIVLRCGRLRQYVNTDFRPPPRRPVLPGTSPAMLRRQLDKIQ